MTKLDNAIGRYVYVSVDDLEYRVYYEEAGTGIPLFLQHTAGADGTQWRHLLEDKEITSKYRVVAYDLPYHGKSLPPTSVRWWEQDYRLTPDFFMKFVIALATELGCKGGVYMGSSMGGNLAPDLALYHPGFFRAAIGLEAALKSAGFYLDNWFHPEIGNESKAAFMYSLTAPMASESGRRETAWVYSQGSPPVFKGDLFYYSVEHDLRGVAHKIDTTKTALYVMNGEYDFATTPEDGRELVAAIKGAKYVEMPELGHFPMSEDGDRFLKQIKPVLWEISESARNN